VWTDCASANVTLLHFPKSIALGIRLVHLPKCDVHEIVAVYQVSVEGFAVLEFDHLLGGESSSQLCFAMTFQINMQYHGLVLSRIEQR
jgi:hypothetical protein